jgi:hypothetical protein
MATLQKKKFKDHKLYTWSWFYPSNYFNLSNFRLFYLMLLSPTLSHVILHKFILGYYKLYSKLL